jgi:hypothetical protein
MRKAITLSLLLVLALQQTVLLSSSSSNTIITSPISAPAVLEPYHTGANPNFISNGAQWLWQAGGQSWPNGYVAVFQTQFYASCKSPAILTITADNSFSASLNGGAAMTGNDWTKIYKFDLANLLCGPNTLVISVVNLDEGSPAALIFAVTQDQSACFKC